MYVKIIASQKWDVFGQSTIKRSPKNSLCNSASKCYFSLTETYQTRGQ